ncbi:MAG TPA: MFS transporter [Solirubrobacteraceae bacterium]|nr:MFS transporter [Solirubrobacteraceae bacterium]
MTPARSASSAPRPAVSRERAVLATVALAGALVPLNSTMIAVALPRLVEDLDTSLRAAAWLVTAYLIAMASLQPVAGKLGDRLGRRPMVLGGLVWFAVASAGAALADDLALLLAFRLQQAVAGALLMPNGVALVRQTVPAERLGASLGGVGATIAVGAAAGPPLGGVLLAAGGWRWIFLANLPIVAVAFAMGLRSLPAAARADHAAGPRFDRAGAVLLCATLGAGAWALNGAGLSGGAAGALAAAAAVLLVVLVRVELRRDDPVLQPRLFVRGAFGPAAAGVALSNLAMYVTLLALPVLLARRAGFDDGAGAGLALAAMSLASLVVTPLGGRLADRTGPRLPAVAGLGTQAVALVPLALWPATLGGGAIAACLALAGAGLGLASSSLQVAAMAAVEEASAGVAAGVYSTSRYAGSIAGTALLAGPLAPAAHGTGGFAALFAVLVAAAGASAAAAALLPRRIGPVLSAAPGRA